MRRCIVIPAIKKNAVIPDQLVKRLAGVTLIQRALDVARGVVPAQDIIVVTDSQEISLICERNGVRFHYNAALRFTSLDIITEMRAILEEIGNEYDHIIVYRASCPLLTWVDIDEAYRRFLADGSDCLVTVKSIRHRIWEVHEGELEGLLSEGGDSELVVESKALIILRADALRSGTPRKIMPYFLNDRAVEINSYQDWWICERLLMRRHVVFVVAGYPAIGMGHVFRSLMLAHEIAHHKVSFVCTKESELAAASIAAKEYRTCIQSGELWQDVLDLKPDLVINDLLDTDREYMEPLKAAGIPVVNFEDEGSGSEVADLVVNALYEKRGTGEHSSKFLYGHKYFCLRDEFLQAMPNIFNDVPNCILITFGGTDVSDFTRQTLDVVEPICREHRIEIRIVTGPGYAHRESLEAHLATLQVQNPRLRFEYATNVMSRMMEGVDLAICSAGRTVYELAHMRIPGIVLAQHEREARHTFARSRNGFEYLGVMQDFNTKKLEKMFRSLIETPEHRRHLYDHQQQIHFEKNKAQIVEKILCLLERTA